MTAETEALLREARQYVKWAGETAEARHDSDGDYYMDSGMYEIMEDTKALLAKIDKAIGPPREYEELAEPTAVSVNCYCPSCRGRDNRNSP